MLSKNIWRKYKLFTLIGALLLPLAACTEAAIQARNFGAKESQHSLGQLQTIKERGHLICGVSGELAGFSYINSDGNYAGLDVDICRALAAAIFDDPDKVVFRRLSAANRFDVLKSGEVDLLSRNTTQTLSRDTSANLDFTPPVFYDEQGIMVHKFNKIDNVSDLNKKSICVAEKTTGFDNLAEYMGRKKIEYTPLTSSDPDSLYSSYERNLCQAITGDTSQLVARRTMFANPTEHQILPQSISQEPLAPIVRHQDSQWFDVVKWVTFALIEAEELGINSENVSIYKKSKGAGIKSFLGVEGNLGTDMGLSNDFVVRVIKHVGNYGEIYDRNVGQPFGLTRGDNALWKDGGLMYSPPFK